MLKRGQKRGSLGMSLKVIIVLAILIIGYAFVFIIVKNLIGDGLEPQPEFRPDTLNSFHRFVSEVKDLQSGDAPITVPLISRGAEVIVYQRAKGPIQCEERACICMYGDVDKTSVKPICESLKFDVTSKNYFDVELKLLPFDSIGTITLKRTDNIISFETKED